MHLFSSITILDLRQKLFANRKRDDRNAHAKQLVLPYQTNSENVFPSFFKAAFSSKTERKNQKNVIVTFRKYEAIKPPPSKILRHKVWEK
ncbi:hypothetical protein CEXT_313531 [Caerostris extrusa]|uniref:Uncharacterized protein n=1 Tax=Caerostris extrusa TaxID=172846 RepID=A0AAV4Y1G3_CAEEX|nr:hypothetical protein CEXT_313531 [Caerostris extrusa]